MATRLGVVWVDRSRKRDLLRAIPALEAALRSGRSVVLFPEGTTTTGQELLPFRSALIEAAVRADVPVVPVAITSAARGDTSALSWVAKDTLVHSIPRVARLRDTQIGVHFAPAFTPTVTRKVLAVEARQAIARRTAGGAIRAHSPGADRPIRRPSQRGAMRQAIAAQLHSMSASAAGFVAAVLVGVSLLYAQAPVYRFQAPASFRGSAWYNPYQSVVADSSAWLKANFHAHSAAWHGLTAGRQTPADVVERYRALRYDVVGISNYHADVDRRERGTFPVYEHGWNLLKGHRLALGARGVLWFDYPFGATRHQQQDLIDRLHTSSALVAIAHPAMRRGHTPADLQQLANYELLEVLNHFLPPADSAWDAALSSGRPVWLLASDDSHDVTGAGETGTNYTRILAASSSESDVIAALRAGRHYGVRAPGHQATLSLVRLGLHAESLTVVISGAVTTVRIIGQHGVIRGAWRRAGAPSDTQVAVTAAARAEDGYLRVVAEGTNEALYTNPVIRWNGAALSSASLAVRDEPGTVLYRAWWFFGYAWLAVALVVSALNSREQRKRATTPAPHHL